MKPGLHSTAVSRFKTRKPQSSAFPPVVQRKDSRLQILPMEHILKTVLQFLEGEKHNHQITNLSEDQDRETFLESNLQISKLRHSNTEQSLMPIIYSTHKQEG